MSCFLHTIGSTVALVKDVTVSPAGGEPTAMDAGQLGMVVDISLPSHVVHVQFAGLGVPVALAADDIVPASATGSSTPESAGSGSRER